MENFEQVIGRLFLAQAELKAIDPSALTEKRRKERSAQLTALRRAIDQLVTARFNELAAAAKDSALELDRATGELSAALGGIKTAIGVLNAIGAAIGTITSLVRLIKGG